MGYDPDFTGYGRYMPPASDSGEKADREVKPGRFGKFCVIYSLAFCSLYTVAALIDHVITGSEPSTLTACVFAFFGTELVALGTVRVVKKIKEAQGRKAVENAEANPANE